VRAAHARSGQQHAAEERAAVMPVLNAVDVPALAMSTLLVRT
jgi:hypothetical protein